MTRRVECETCEGTGEAMTMKCYGGSPIETTDTCPDCNGQGEREVPEDPMDVTRSMCR